MLWVGLTGGIATGKSTVSQILQSRGWSVIDADQLAREVVQKGTPGFSEIIKTFGSEMIGPDGEIDRKKLAHVVFSEAEKLRSLEAIVHPRVRELTKQRRQELEARGELIAFYDVPLLFEKQMESAFDRIVTVICRPELQIQRLMARNGLNRLDAEARLRAQLPNELKAAKSDFVLNNDGDISSLEASVDGLIEYLKAR